jgi:hypothetical protein
MGATMLRPNEIEAIIAASGFENGQRVSTDQQVRDYFTLANMRLMFGGTDATGQPLAWTQEQLDDVAADVIRNRIHYAP